MQRVFIVDDNEEAQDNLRKISEKLDCKCDLAAGGKETIKLAMSSRYTAILLDINMPYINGFQIAAHIRNTPEINQRVPIIYISPSTVEICFTYFMEKPVRSKQLESMLKLIEISKTSAAIGCV